MSQFKRMIQMVCAAWAVVGLMSAHAQVTTASFDDTVITETDPDAPTVTITPVDLVGTV
jgi:hypothetical protein